MQQETRLGTDPHSLLVERRLALIGAAGILVIVLLISWAAFASFASGNPFTNAQIQDIQETVAPVEGVASQGAASLPPAVPTSRTNSFVAVGYRFQYPADWHQGGEFGTPLKPGTVSTVTVQSADKTRAVRFLVYSRLNLFTAYDACSTVSYDVNSGKWGIRTSDATHGCDGREKSIAVANANTTVGTAAAYGVWGGNESRFLVPLQSTLYGLEIQVRTTNGGGVDAEIQSILNSVRISPMPE